LSSNGRQFGENEEKYSYFWVLPKAEKVTTRIITRPLSAVSLAVGILLFPLCVFARAQQSEKVPRIGYLTATSPSAIASRTEAFLGGLRELGYVDGKNIVVEYRYGEGKADRLPVLAVELLRLKVNVIVTSGPAATRPAKKATNTIPIVMAQDNDPVGNGFVASLAQPGGNITGLSTLSPQLSGKRLEILKEVLPRLSRVAVFDNSTDGNVQALRETELAAAAFGVKLQYLDVRSAKDIETAFRGAGRERADAVLVLPNQVHFSQRTQIAELAIKSRLPRYTAGQNMGKPVAL
jgi:putative ABC transport system substrate-binding protein